MKTTVHKNLHKRENIPFPGPPTENEPPPPSKLYRHAKARQSFLTIWSHDAQLHHQ